MQVDKVAVVEPYGEDRRQDLEIALRDLGRGTGDVTVIVIRSR
jgi:hypothetical protein